MSKKSEVTTSPVSISSAEDFHAKTSRLLVKALESQSGPALAFGLNSDESLENLDPDSSSSKTSQAVLVDGCQRCGETCTCLDTIQKPWGLALETLEPLTSESESSLLPTPTAQGYGSNQGGAAGRSGAVRHSLQSMATKNLWPTPTVTGNYNRKGASKNSGDVLATAVNKNLWPTPRASANENRQYKPSPSQLAGTHGKSLAAEVGGPLNPEFVEWLMGFPLEWTALSPSEMPSSRNARKSSAK